MRLPMFWDKIGNSNVNVFLISSFYLLSQKLFMYDTQYLARSVVYQVKSKRKLIWMAEANHFYNCLSVQPASLVYYIFFFKHAQHNDIDTSLICKNHIDFTVQNTRYMLRSINWGHLEQIQRILLHICVKNDYLKTKKSNLDKGWVKKW